MKMLWTIWLLILARCGAHNLVLVGMTALQDASLACYLALGSYFFVGSALLLLICRQGTMLPMQVDWLTRFDYTSSRCRRWSGKVALGGITLCAAALSGGCYAASLLSLLLHCPLWLGSVSSICVAASLAIWSGGTSVCRLIQGSVTGLLFLLLGDTETLLNFIAYWQPSIYAYSPNSLCLLLALIGYHSGGIQLIITHSWLQQVPSAPSKLWLLLAAQVGILLIALRFSQAVWSYQSNLLPLEPAGWLVAWLWLALLVPVAIALRLLGDVTGGFSDCALPWRIAGAAVILIMLGRLESLLLLYLLAGCTILWLIYWMQGRNALLTAEYLSGNEAERKEKCFFLEDSID